ncbi:tetratricopeptide repeat protein [Synechococcales cyanobacterium C]|uniref:Tetratricopeptide repeat protein n=1 Tax=Petrachloros mirabilis ULC683 TaxID=2781853 RepID=A0A8K2ABQ7_9CYAN|nr:tetratricopeptide repeat protein [Petrachloros mirabilis]NCJ04971.1 tetratricopeptide repeat protein [Petrachloros mirabilis ULC683]
MKRIFEAILGKLRLWFSFQGNETPLPGGSLAKVYGEDLKSAEALTNRANKRAAIGDTEGALEDFNEALQLSPERAIAYFDRGFVLNTMNRPQEALADFNRVLELLPDYDEAYFQRGISRLKLEDPTGAIQDFSLAIKLNPFCIKAYYRRAEAYKQLGDAQGALGDYTQVTMRVPKDANAHYQRGLFLLQMGQFDQAVADLTTAIDRNPRHADAFYHRGHCFSQLGNPQQAAEDYNQALLINPNHEAAYYNRVYGAGILRIPRDPFATSEASLPKEESLPTVTLAHQGAVLSTPGAAVSDQEANIHLGQTVKLEPTSLKGYLQRAQERFLSGTWEGAIADYTKVLELDPENSQAYFKRGQSYSALGQTELAMEDLNQSLHWARVHSLGVMRDFSDVLSDTLDALNQPDPPLEAQPITIEATIADYSQAIEDNPLDAQAYFQRGKSRALIGDLEGAIADYTQSIQLDPTYSEAFYRRGQCRSALRDMAGATEDLNQAIRHKPTSASLWPSLPPASPTALPAEPSPLGMPLTANAHGINYASGEDWLSPSGDPKSKSDIAAENCTHGGNLPGNRYCIHCGATLSSEPNSEPNDAVTQPLPLPAPPGTSATASMSVTPPTVAPLQEAEQFFQRGLALAEAGEGQASLDALGQALNRFLSLQQMQRYQETLSHIQMIAQDLS